MARPRGVSSSIHFYLMFGPQPAILSANTQRIMPQARLRFPKEQSWFAAVAS
jgi:hypothetical protein